MSARRATTTILAALVLALPWAAHADTVDIVNDGFGASSWTTFWAAGHYGDEVVAGVYSLNKTAGTGTGDTWHNGYIAGFCVELEEAAPHTTRTYQVTMPDDVYNSTTGQLLGSTKGNYLRELWGRYYDSSWAGSGPFSDTQNSAAEAFAAAIWEIIYEDLPASPLGWDVRFDSTPGSGGFAACDLDTDTANKWLHELTGSGPKADLRAFVCQGGQDYLVMVPEPATVLMLGLGGLLSLVGRRRVRA
jgi:hypothetical protein